MFGMIFKASAITFTERMVGVALTLVAVFCLARLLGPSDFGEYSMLLSLALFTATVLNTGRSTTAIKYLSREDRVLSRSRIDALVAEGYRAIFRTTLATGLCALVVFASLRTSVVDRFTDGPPPEASTFLAVAMLGVLLALIDYQSHVCRSLGFLHLAVAPKEILWRSLYLVVVVAALAVAAPVSAETMVSWCAAALLLAGTYQFGAAGLSVRAMLAGARARADTGSDGRDTRRFWFIAIFNAAVNHLSVVLVGLTIDPVAAGQFFLALRIANLLKIPLQASMVVAGPMISAAFDRQALDRLREVSHALTLIVFVTSLAGSLGFALLGPTVFGWLGAEYVAAHRILMWLAVLIVIEVSLGPSGMIANMTGRDRAFAWALFASGGVTLLLLPFAAIYTGAIGAAVVVGFYPVLWKLVLMSRVRRDIGFDCTLVGCLRREPGVASP